MNMCFQVMRRPNKDRRQQVMRNSPHKKLIIIGAPKGGTTSLANWLDSHPKIQLGQEKEPRFFTDYARRKWVGPNSRTFARLSGAWVRCDATSNDMPGAVAPQA